MLRGRQIVPSWRLRSSSRFLEQYKVLFFRVTNPLQQWDVPVPTWSGAQICFIPNILSDTACLICLTLSLPSVVLTLFNCCRGPLCASLLVKSCARTLKLVFTFLCIQSISIIPPQTWITNMHIHDTVYNYKSFFKASHLRAKNGFPVRDTIQLSHKDLHKKQNTTKRIIFIEYSNKSLSNLGLN